MTKPFEPYSNENLRFRKAYIRERLHTLKHEREALLLERQMIDEALHSKRKAADGLAAPLEPFSEALVSVS